MEDLLEKAELYQFTPDVSAIPHISAGGSCDGVVIGLFFKSDDPNGLKFAEAMESR